MYVVVVNGIRFPDWYNLDSPTGTTNIQGEDFLKLRNELSKIFQSISRIPELLPRLTASICHLLGEAKQNLESLPPSQVELPLHLMYLLAAFAKGTGLNWLIQILRRDWRMRGSTLGSSKECWP